MNKIVSVLLFVIGLPVAAFSASGSEGNPPLGIPPITNYNTANLGYSPVNFVTTYDRYGRLIVGNNNSVMIYDGTNWSFHTVPGFTVFGMHSTEDRIYTAGYSNFGYIDLNASEFTYVNLLDRLEDEIGVAEFWRVYDHNGVVFFSTNRGFVMWDESSDTLEYFQLGSISTGAFLNESGLNLFSEEGIYRFNDELASFELHPFDDINILYDDDRPAFVLTLGEQDKRIITRYGKFYAIVNGELTLLNELGDFHAYHAKILHNGLIAVATLGDGILFLNSNGEIVNWLTESHGLSDDTVYHLHQEGSGPLWASTFSGISRIDVHLPATKFDINYGFNAEHVLGTAVNGDYLYISTNNGVKIVSLESVTSSSSAPVFEVIEGLEDIAYQIIPYNNGVLAKTLGNIYYASGRDLAENVMRVSLNQLSVCNKSNHIYGAERYGDLLIIEDGEVIKRVETGFEIAELSVVAPGEVVVVSFEDEVFHITIFDKTTEEQQLLKSDEITAEFEVTPIDIPYRIDSQPFLITDHGHTYISSGNELYLSDYESRTARRVDKFHSGTAKPLNIGNININNIKKFESSNEQEDDVRRFVVSSSSGIHIHHLQGTENILVDRLLTSFLPSANENSLSQIGNNRFIYGSGSELVMFTYVPNFGEKANFRAGIREVVRDRDEVLYDITSRKIQGERLEYADNDFRFTFFSSDFLIPNRNRFQYRLEPIEDEWSEWSNERIKDYTRLREGRYTFNVRGMSSNGLISPTVSYSFVIMPPWYRTWWAYMFYGISFALILYSAHRYRLSQLLEVERTRTRIARDLHDEIGSNLSTISLIAELLKKKKTLAEKDYKKLDNVGFLSKEMTESLREIVWFINPENDDPGDLILKMKELAERMLSGVKYEFRVEGSGYFKNLNLEKRRHIFLILKEALNNIIKHSEAKKVTINLSLPTTDTFRMEIEDNGVGMDLETVKRGNGINNLQRRADEINGKMEVTSTAGKGTRIVLSAPNR